MPILGAASRVAEVERCLASGFVGHVAKPISLMSLLSSIKAVSREVE